MAMIQASSTTDEAPSSIHSLGIHSKTSLSLHPIHLSLMKTQHLPTLALIGRRLRKPNVFKADLPSLKKDQVKVEIEDDRVLQISGERNVEKEDKNDTWHRIERSNGEFLRRFRLPENAKIDQVKASMENEVLTVTVPKEEVKKPDIKAIEISD